MALILFDFDGVLADTLDDMLHFAQAVCVELGSDRIPTPADLDALECAFLTLAVPHGFDFVLGTPWRGYHALPDDHYVLATYRHFLEQRGSNALRAVRRFYKAATP